MTQAELERELSLATGETVSEIRHRGFNLVVLPTRHPLTIDWDAVQAIEPIRYRSHRRRRRCAA